MKVLLFGFIAFVIFMITGAIYRSFFLRRKWKTIVPYGKMVDIKDGIMHVYSIKGSSNKKIVLLPGLGTPLPSADFAPLMREISQYHTAICIEYFGVGFSSTTSRERSIENYVEEIRESLAKAGFAKPYVLMPHSFSSLYCEFYASKYPDEVEAIISLDGTSSAHYEKVPGFVKYLMPIGTYMQRLGIIPIIAILTTNKKKLLSYGYAEKEVGDAIIFSGFSMNKNVLEQMVLSGEQVKEVMEMPFPSNIPYLKIISKQTYAMSEKHLKMSPEAYQQGHLERIGNKAKYEVLEGSHFIHVNNAKQITVLTNKLLFTEKDKLKC